MTLKIIKNLKTTYTFKYFIRIWASSSIFTYYTCTFSRLFKPPGSGSGRTFTIRIHADLDLQHWFPLVQNKKIIQTLEDPDLPIKERNNNWIFACFVDLYWDPRKVMVPPPEFAVFSWETGIWNGTPWWGLTSDHVPSNKCKVVWII